MNDRRLDLNLMLVFEALLEEHSVTRAAARLGLGQPATSNALARLRTLYDDALFVRSGGAMLPTSRAAALAEPVRTALATLRAATSPPSAFDPATARHGFAVSGGDYASMVVLPQLHGVLRTRAPGVDIFFRYVEKDRIPGLLDKGELDLALGVFPKPSKRFALNPLFEDHFVCVARPDHPALRDGLTAETYAALPHVLVTERGDRSGAVDEALRRRGLARRVAMTVPHVLVVPWLLQDGDMIATVGARAASRMAATVPLSVHDAPIAIPPWRLSMLTSRQRAGDPPLEWLRGVLAEIGKGVG